MKIFDLHVHTTASDGSDDPESILLAVKEMGLSGVSFTDHDTLGSYTPEVFKLAEELGLELIPGIECSSYLDRFGVHILGYFVDIECRELKEFCRKHQQRRRNRNCDILALLKHAGIEITEEELYKDSNHTVGRPHIAKLMIEKGYVEDISAAFQKYIGEGKPYYTPGEQIGIAETIEVIHKAGGLAFLAHPILLKRKNLINNVLKHDFDGLEGFYASFPRDRVQPFIDMAKKHNLLVSGGSDYHGAIKYNKLGSSFVTKEDLERIKAAL